MCSSEHGLNSRAGFSLVETSIVTLVILVILGFALPGVDSIRRRIDGDAAMNQTVAQLRRGRELAISQRRNIEMQFANDREIELVRCEIPAGTTTLSTLILDNRAEFILFNGLPDSPDFFGNSAAVDFGATMKLTFLSDGTLVDDQGNPVSGSIFLGIQGHPETARVVTIIGATGRVRGYRWDGNDWHH